MTEPFEAFYEREFQPVFRTVWLLCRDGSLAEEITQEAFARTLERWKQVGDQPWRGGYVTSIAVNLVRRHKKQLKTPLTDLAASDETERSLDLWNIVARLARRERQAVVLFYRLDLPIEQVALAMGCRASTARAHLTRARQRLRGELKDEERSDGRHGSPNRSADRPDAAGRP